MTGQRAVARERNCKLPAGGEISSTGYPAASPQPMLTSSRGHLSKEEPQHGGSNGSNSSRYSSGSSSSSNSTVAAAAATAAATTTAADAAATTAATRATAGPAAASSGRPNLGRPDSGSQTRSGCDHDPESTARSHGRPPSGISCLPATFAGTRVTKLSVPPHPGRIRRDTPGLSDTVLPQQVPEGTSQAR
jgi:hypothetical protein